MAFTRQAFWDTDHRNWLFSAVTVGWRTPICNFINLSFDIRSDHLKSVNQIILFHSVCFMWCSRIACFSILVSTWLTQNVQRCSSCGRSAHNQCGYIVSLQWCPRRVLCLLGGLLQLWSVAYTTMCTVISLSLLFYIVFNDFVPLLCIFTLCFSLFVVCLHPYIFIDILPCTLMFLCEIRAIKILYSYSFTCTDKGAKPLSEPMLEYC